MDPKDPNSYRAGNTKPVMRLILITLEDMCQ